MIFGKKIALALLLIEKRISGKFDCTGTCYAQMHKEQTNKHSSSYIRLAEIPDDHGKNEIQCYS